MLAILVNMSPSRHVTHVCASYARGRASFSSYVQMLMARKRKLTTTEEKKAAEKKAAQSEA